MKRRIIILTCICMMVGLSACEINKNTKVETGVVKEENPESDTENTDDSFIKVNTNYFSVSVPTSW